MILLIITESDIAEFNRAVFHFFVFAFCFVVIEVDFCHKNLFDTFRRSQSTRSLNHDHSNHHQRHENLYDIRRKCGQVADRHIADDDLASTKPYDRHRRNVHRKSHDRHRQNNDLHRRQTLFFQVFIGFVKSFFFKLVTHKRFYHACVCDIFLNSRVQAVDFGLHDVKSRKCFPDYDNQRYDQNRDYHSENDRQSRIHHDRHDQSTDQHPRCSKEHSKCH